MDSRKTKTKAVTMFNRSKHEHGNELMKARSSNYSIVFALHSIPLDIALVACIFVAYALAMGS